MDRKIRIGYSCSYVPSSLLEQAGLEMIKVSERELENLAGNKDMLNTLCSLALKSTAVIDACDLDGFIFTNCCNSMQRAYDYLIHKGKKVYLLEIERKQREDYKEYYTHCVRELLEHIAYDFPIQKNLNNITIKAGWNIPMWKNDFDEKAVLVIANIIPTHIEKLFHDIIQPCRLIIKSCHRMICDQEEKNPSVLEREPCVHSFEFAKWLEELLQKNQEKLYGIIFLTSSYCDASLFMYPYLRKTARKYNIPEICLETSFDYSGMGQVATRVEAFMEGIQNRKIYQYQSTSEEFKSKKQDVHLDAVISSLQESGTIRADMKENITFLTKIRYVRAVVGKMEYDCLKTLISYQIDMVINKLKGESEKIVWTNMVMPVELFYSMGLIPVHIELISGWLASLGLSKHYIMLAESMGIASAVCSYHKAVLGLLISEECLHPKTMVFASTICDGGFALGEYCSQRFGTNTFSIEVPYEDNEESCQFVSKQYETLIYWLEQNTGMKYSKKKFEEALQLSNQSRKGWIEANRMRKDTPDFKGRLALRNLFGTTFLFGSKIGVQVVEEYKKDIQRLQKQKTGEKRRKRILWVHFSPLYRNELLEYMEEDLGLSVSADIVSYIYWNEYKMEDGILDVSKRLLSHFYIGNEKRRKNIFNDIINEYEIDGIIHYMHRGCRTIGGSAWLIRELALERHLPYMELHGDCIDPRGNASQQDFTRLEAFKESLEGV